MQIEDLLLEKFNELEKLKIMLINDPRGDSEDIIRQIQDIELDLALIAKNFRAQWIYEDLDCYEDNFRAQNLTLEELKKYNGMNGQPAFIAVDGIIYDVTDNKAWKGGKHSGLQAGQDVSAEFKNCHWEGLKTLDKLKVVGTLIT